MKIHKCHDKTCIKTKGDILRKMYPDTRNLPLAIDPKQPYIRCECGQLLPVKARYGTYLRYKCKKCYKGKIINLKIGV